MDKLLIVGIESLSGSNLAFALEDRFVVSGVSRDRSLQLEGIDVCVVRRDDLAGLEKHVAAVAPRWILHCPLSAASSWDLDPAVSTVSDESAAAVTLADWAAKHDARLTVLSTDAVFAGPHMFHEEGSPPTASGVWPEAARWEESAFVDKTALGRCAAMCMAGVRKKIVSPNRYGRPAPTGGRWRSTVAATPRPC